MNKVLVIGNRRRWNGVSVFGAGNAQRSSTLVAHVPGDSHISLLNRNGGRVPLDSLWHGERGGNFCASPFLAAFRSPLPAHSTFVFTQTKCRNGESGWHILQSGLAMLFSGCQWSLPSTRIPYCRSHFLFTDPFFRLQLLSDISSES